MKSQEQFETEVRKTTKEIFELAEKNPESFTPEKIQEYRSQVVAWISEKAEAAIAFTKPYLEGSAVSSIGLSPEIVREEAMAAKLYEELARNEKAISELASSAQDQIQILPESHPEKTVEKLHYHDEEALLHNEIGAEQIPLGGTTGRAVKVGVIGYGPAAFKTFAGLEDPEARQKHINREIAAYEISDALGWDIVEPTVERTINGQKGSLQTFLKEAKIGGDLSSEELNALQDDILKLEIFDNLIFNTDRPIDEDQAGQENLHPGNFFLKHGKIKGIDHAEAFNIEHAFDPQSKGSDHLFKKLDKQKIPSEVYNGLKTLLSSPDKISALRNKLTKLLSGPVADACLTRIIDFGTSISQDGNFSVSEFKNKLEKYSTLKELIDTGVMYE